MHSARYSSFVKTPPRLVRCSKVGSDIIKPCIRERTRTKAIHAIESSVPLALILHCWDMLDLGKVRGVTGTWIALHWDQDHTRPCIPSDREVEIDIATCASFVRPIQLSTARTPSPFAVMDNNEPFPFHINTWGRSKPPFSQTVDFKPARTAK